MNFRHLLGCDTIVFEPEVTHGLSFARFLDSLTMGKVLLYAFVTL